MGSKAKGSGNDENEEVESDWSSDSEDEHKNVVDNSDNINNKDKHKD